MRLVETGDEIRLDVPARRLDLMLEERELSRRAARPCAHTNAPERGYARLFQDSVLQADEGCDFDFLVPGKGKS